MSSISRERRVEIEKVVEQLKLDTGFSYPENGLLEIASALGVEVLEADLPDFNDKKVKGLIQWFNDEKKKEQGTNLDAKIFLNSNLSPTTKSFTLAHEIGHFILHKGEDSYRIDFQDYSAEADPKNQETEANYFAGALLMPKEKLLKAISGAKNLEDVAAAFAVSRPAVESRLKWLGFSL